MINPKEEIPSRTDKFTSNFGTRKNKPKKTYPYDKLKLGESFDVGVYSIEEDRRMSPYTVYYNKSRGNFGKHFCHRKVIVGGITILRIYRDDVFKQKK